MISFVGSVSIHMSDTGADPRGLRLMSLKFERGDTVELGKFCLFEGITCRATV
jgi:hypothetical protein